MRKYIIILLCLIGMAIGIDKRYLQPEVSDASEVIQLKLWEGTAFDYSLNGNDGTATKTSIGNSCFEFNGTTSIITCGSDTTIDDIFVGGGSITWWQRSDGRGESNTGRTISKGNWYINMVTDTTHMQVYQTFTGGDDGVWTFPIATGVWQHIAIVYNNSVSTNDPVVYVNGVSVTVTDGATQPGSEVDTADAAANLIIGNKSDGTETWDGAISDVRMLTTVRTAVQIKSLYEQTKWRY